MTVRKEKCIVGCGKCKYKPVFHTITFSNGYTVEIIRHCKSVGGDDGLYEYLLFKGVHMIGTIVGNLTLQEVKGNLKLIRRYP